MPTSYNFGRDKDAEDEGGEAEDDSILKNYFQSSFKNRKLKTI